MMLPTDVDENLYYWFTSSNGETTHHFETTGKTYHITGNVVPEMELVQDWYMQYDNDSYAVVRT